MTWKGHVGFAIALVVAVGLFYVGDFGKLPPSKPVTYYYKEKPASSSVLEDGRRYKPMSPPKRSQPTSYGHDKTFYDHVCQVVELASNIVPIIVAIAWVVTTIRSRRAST